MEQGKVSNITTCCKLILSVSGDIVSFTVDGASLISVPPESFNANLGGEAIFTCVIHENVSDVLWIVRGVDRRAYTQTFSDDGTTVILTIPTVAEENDGAEVVCKPFTPGGATEESEPAILRVQGMCSLVAST